jgi:hypothetical protein
MLWLLLAGAAISDVASFVSYEAAYLYAKQKKDTEQSKPSSGKDKAVKQQRPSPKGDFKRVCDFVKGEPSPISKTDIAALYFQVAAASTAGCKQATPATTLSALQEAAESTASLPDFAFANAALALRSGSEDFEARLAMVAELLRPDGRATDFRQQVTGSSSGLVYYLAAALRKKVKNASMQPFVDGVRKLAGATDLAKGEDVDVQSAGFFVRSFSAITKGHPLEDGARMQRLLSFRRYLGLYAADGCAGQPAQN